MIWVPLVCVCVCAPLYMHMARKGSKLRNIGRRSSGAMGWHVCGVCGGCACVRNWGGWILRGRWAAKKKGKRRPQRKGSVEALKQGAF